ncbi:RdgB/HAM1 family non-canonical purine NTP pyrophosphatase [Flammeovirga sp. EKP202]|uniref:RdgB/HAM1 family non-canonical purine NTP pyrophosphatase n=1 Tax=Flammeovirga sp. EKP202 TaxID=2770592 RepID=UPI00165F8E60|nr:RdgB/HAM1 family non-canonical purine NTP pyrophosphatase [Flammeovirga sp. EKP202]MBD0404153.1 RdgB/HAM1 family non-canonical purine NTP pyrophosphatase [Flammeovirga sp. EKP202]
MKKICFATNNVNKLKEIQQQLDGLYTIVSLKEIGCEEELPETQETLEGNSLQKAQYVWNNYGVSCFADDTGLEVTALNNEPGVYSARYAGPQRDSEDNMDLVLKNLEGKKDRSAKFRTVITLLWEGNVEQVEGEAKGDIISERTGDQGFGYDPIFRPENETKTFAQLSSAEKNKISHRGRAVSKLIELLKDKV